MTTRTATQPNCSIARTLDLVTDRWSFLILREAHLGTTRFADFRDYLRIAPNILTNRLASLVESGLLEKRDYRAEGERTRSSYHLTPAGADLKLVLAALQQWGDVHVPREAGPTVLRRDRRSRELVDVGFVTEDGTAVPDEDVEFEPVAGGPADRGTWR
ncbi:HxlR family transcriptional regulator [Kribbella amoyensis]|uniref:HxlR family transcriptional regulator n=1 Tax=Kribbella amoyensis TaxID=996641 RepID=A0A561B7X2_9ACTN|nr:helix-turn-helix domain-containing protein [Kribbella amoyensis]TWD74858.1 HxlR family transcriptional regulator [Kribbella amoyensis]